MNYCMETVSQHSFNEDDKDDFIDQLEQLNNTGNPDTLCSFDPSDDKPKSYSRSIYVNDVMNNLVQCTRSVEQENVRLKKTVHLLMHFKHLYNFTRAHWTTTELSNRLGQDTHERIESDLVEINSKLNTLVTNDYLTGDDKSYTPFSYDPIESTLEESGFLPSEFVDVQLNRMNDAFDETQLDSDQAETDDDLEDDVSERELIIDHMTALSDQSVTHINPSVLSNDELKVRSHFLRIYIIAYCFHYFNRNINKFR